MSYFIEREYTFFSHFEGKMASLKSLEFSIAKSLPYSSISLSMPLSITNEDSFMRLNNVLSYSAFFNKFAKTENVLSSLVLF